MAGPDAAAAAGRSPGTGDAPRPPVSGPLFEHPLRLLLLLTLVIFLAEFAIMGLLHRFPRLSLPLEAFLDGLLLMLVVVPSLALLMFRPLSMQIRERERAEASRRESDSLLRELLDSNPGMMYIRDPQGVIRLGNQALARFYGVAPERLAGSSQRELHEAAGLDADALRRSLAEDRQVVDFGTPLFTFDPLPLPDGDTIWYRTSRFPVTVADGTRCVQVISHDDSPRVRAEAALRRAHEELERRVEERTAELVHAAELLKRVIDERNAATEEIRASREQLRNLTARVESLREEERTRISREIHDELGQSLTALRLDLAMMARDFWIDGLGRFSRKAEAMARLVDTILATVKRISADLRPGVLDELGLAVAIEWQAKRFRERTGISCEARVEPAEVSVERSTATALFRILQESLTNVAQHALALNVAIRLERQGGRLVLEVADDGVGITEAQLVSAGSLGLIGIRERVRLLGGEVAIGRGPRKGTVVRVTVPGREEEVRDAAGAHR